jgi:GntR family transcriptional regulator, transcriptional repressor for pyruvate dehydrogenase complex
MYRGWLALRVTGCRFAGVDRAGAPERTPALEAVFKPVQPPTTFEETVERLGTAIRLGLLVPGIRLPPERDLAEQLRISRSTLRQALTTLVQSGHLVSVRGRAGGTFVADEPPLGQVPDGEVLTEDARAVLDYRVAVETGAIVLAAERAVEEDLNRLLEWAERMTEAGPFEEYRRADVRFHIGVAEASHSPRLITAMTEVQGQMSDLIHRIAHPRQVLVASNQQHVRLVSLLRRRDTGRAVRLMRGHMEGTEHILAGLLPERPG